MMKRRDVTPEEKLLNLIKNKKHEKLPQEEKTAGKVSEPAGITPRAADSSFPKESEPNNTSLPASKTEEKILRILKSEIFKSEMFDPSRLKLVNRYLIIASCVLSLYFFIELLFLRPQKNMQTISAKGLPAQGGAGRAESGGQVIVKDYSAYSDSVTGKSVFGKTQAQVPGEDVNTADSITERVGLVGIISGDNPQAIIEDKKAQKTYYLTVGQSFDGYLVEQVGDDKVVLDYEGKKISLFL